MTWLRGQKTPKNHNKQFCCNKDQFHAFYNDEFLLHVPILNKLSIFNPKWWRVCNSMHHLLNWTKAVLSPGTYLSFKTQFSGTKDLFAMNVMNLLHTKWTSRIMVSMCKTDKLGYNYTGKIWSWMWSFHASLKWPNSNPVPKFIYDHQVTLWIYPMLQKKVAMQSLIILILLLAHMQRPGGNFNLNKT